MNKILLTTGLALALFSCQEQANTETTSAPQESVAAPAGKEAVQEKAPEKKPAAESFNSALSGLEGMAVDAAMEEDQFKTRLTTEMGEVQAVLSASNAEFEKDGQYLIAEGEVKNDGKPFLVMLVADLKNDAISAAQYDSASDEVTSFSEKEGTEMPVPLQRWVDDWK